MPLVKLYANLRKLAGTKELSIAGVTVGAVVNRLAQQHPSVGDVIFENGELRRHIVVTLNGHNIIDLQTPATEEDIVAIFPPIAGGASPLIPSRHSHMHDLPSKSSLGERPLGVPTRRGRVRRSYGWLV